MHSNNHVVVVIGERDKCVIKKRLNSEVLATLEFT